jgi:transposase InsO family protein
LTLWGRQELVRRVLAGTPVAHVAEAMNVSRPTAYKWWRRYEAEPDGEWWLDASSRPHSSPTQTRQVLEDRIVRLRRRHKLGPLRIAHRLDVPASTVYRVLRRRHLNRLAWMDRPTGRVIRRYEHPNPGDLIHVDIKKLGKIPPGGGWRVHGRQARPGRHRRVGYAYIHTAIDDHSRLAYSEIHDDETATTATEFWARAHAFYAAHGITVGAVLTDNGSCYRSRLFNAELAATGTTHRFCRPYRPQTNGKVERFNRTLLDEWAYVRPYRSEGERRRRLDKWLHLYNHHRSHTSLGGLTPADRVNNLPAHYS